MDFRLTKEQQSIKKAAREFAEGEFPQIAKECDEEEKFDLKLLEKARDLGFVGANIPEEYGGPGLSTLDRAIIMEEFWRIDPGLGQAISSVTFGSEILMNHASEEQKKKYLVPLVEGNAIIATAITEPDAGSDVTGVQTTAVREGNEWVINGSKTFITNGTLADYTIVFCKTHPDESNRHKQFSMFIVEKNMVGFRATKLKNKLGIRASDTAELSFNNVRVPAENLIGDEKSGFNQTLTLFNRERLVIAAQATGLAQGALEQAIRHISQRKQFGQKISSFQAIRFKIAEMGTLIEAGRSLYYRAAWSVDSGKEDHSLIAMAKWFCAYNAVNITQEALQMHGGYGYFNEYDIARFYRDSKILEIYEGTREIEKVVIANAMLGRAK
ncbi:MAG: acyl-CoA dehydrogenase family protein [Deltaproteobacteria bacterium]|nr:acyl-CoA dehydrogenase family protein [Deltaproteobacteria bacterium]